MTVIPLRGIRHLQLKRDIAVRELAEAKRKYWFNLAVGIVAAALVLTTAMAMHFELMESNVTACIVIVNAICVIALSIRDSGLKRSMKLSQSAVDRAEFDVTLYLHLDNNKY